MARIVADPIASSPLNRMDKLAAIEAKASVQRMDLPEDSLEIAKKSFGRAVKVAIGDSSLKEFGDPSLVNRITDGDISNVIGRVWQRNGLALVKALAKESGAARVHTTIEFDEPIKGGA